MSAPVFLTTLTIIFGTILAIFGMRYYAQWQKAKVQSDADEAMRLRLDALEASVTEIKSRLVAIDTLLKDVE